MGDYVKVRTGCGFCVAGLVAAVELDFEEHGLDCFAGMKLQRLVVRREQRDWVKSVSRELTEAWFGLIVFAG